MPEEKSGNLSEEMSGNFSEEMSGNLSGEMSGNFSGEISGNLSGEISGNLSGEISGKLRGEKSGRLRGEKSGRLSVEKKGEITFNIEHSPTYASLVLELKLNQTVLVESSAMAAMDSCITMKSKIKGSLMTGLNQMLAEESFFIREFTATKPGKLYISPGLPGDIRHYYLSNQCGLIVQSSGFVACGTTVEIDSQFEGVKGFLSGESLFLLRASGTGDFWFSSYGGIIEIPIEDDYIVDTGYVVAFEDTLEYQVGMIDGLSWKGLQKGIFGGEGLICRFNGKGRLWIQSRPLYSLVNFLNPFRPSKSSSMIKQN